MNTPKELKARYPYQFEGQAISMSFARGWLPAFAQLCTSIDHALGDDKRGFHWRQIKEKFGAARVYFQLGPGMSDQYPELTQQLLELKVIAEVSSQHLCAACGQPGAIAPGSNWMLALCDVHRKELAEGKPLSIWFSEDDQ
jgi:hypothetical protein